MAWCNHRAEKLLFDPTSAPLVLLRIEHGDAATIIYHTPECEMFELD